MPTDLAAGPYVLAGRDAAAAWEALGCPYEAALALADAGDEPALREAHDRLRGLGARPAAAIVARRLRVRGARDVRHGPQARTREKTVHHHVSAVLRKLDVRTRGQAGAQARRLGLLDDLAKMGSPTDPAASARP